MSDNEGDRPMNPQEYKEFLDELFVNYYYDYRDAIDSQYEESDIENAINVTNKATQQILHLIEKAKVEARIEGGVYVLNQVAYNRAMDGRSTIKVGYLMQNAEELSRSFITIATDYSFDMTLPSNRLATPRNQNDHIPEVRKKVSDE